MMRYQLLCRIKVFFYCRPIDNNPKANGVYGTNVKIFVVLIFLPFNVEPENGSNNVCLDLQYVHVCLWYSLLKQF